MDDETSRLEEAPHGGSGVPAGVRVGRPGIRAGGATGSRPDGGKSHASRGRAAAGHNAVGYLPGWRAAGYRRRSPLSDATPRLPALGSPLACSESGGEGMPRSAGCPPPLVVTVLTGRLRGLVDVFAEFGADPTGGLANLETEPTGRTDNQVARKSYSCVKMGQPARNKQFLREKVPFQRENRRETEEALTELAQPVRRGGRPNTTSPPSKRWFEIMTPPCP